MDALRLEKLQLAVARAVLRLRRQDVGDAVVLAPVGWPTLTWRRRLHSPVLAPATWRGPPVLAAALPAPASERAPQYALRKSADVELPVCHSKQHLSSFLPAAAIWWNSLPSALHSVSSLPLFYRSLCSHCQSDCFIFGIVVFVALVFFFFTKETLAIS